MKIHAPIIQSHRQTRAFSRGGSMLFMLLAAFPVTVFALNTVFASRLSATTHRAKDRVIIKAESRVDDDLLVTAGTCKIDGLVDGDVISFSKDFRLSGTITGAAVVVAQTSTIDGDIYHSLGLFCERAFISGTMRGSGYVFAEKVEVDEDALLKRDVRIFCENLFFGGTISGKLKCITSQATISGSVNQDVEIEAGETLRILETARIGGDLIVRGPTKLDIEEGAEITGEVIRLEKEEPGALSLSSILSFLYTVGALFLLAVVMFGIARLHFQRSAHAVRREPLRSLAFGLIVCLGGLFAAFMLAITFVGLLAASILFLSLMALLFLFGPLYTAGGIGDTLIAPGRKAGAVLRIFRIFAGVVILLLLASIPYAGVPIYVLAGFIGFGAFIIAARDRHESIKLAGSLSEQPGSSDSQVDRGNPIQEASN